jgi:uncharacterized membrane protein
VAMEAEGWWTVPSSDAIVQYIIALFTIMFDFGLLPHT